MGIDFDRLGIEPLVSVKLRVFHVLAYPEFFQGLRRRRVIGRRRGFLRVIGPDGVARFRFAIGVFFFGNYTRNALCGLDLEGWRWWRTTHGEAVGARHTSSFQVSWNSQCS